MKIAILSDIHDNKEKLQQALTLIRDAEAEVILCLGDLCSPFIVKELGSGFPGPIHVVFGNNDGDRFRIALQARNFSQIKLHGEFVELTLGEKLFSLNHFDNIGRALARAKNVDVVCFGHNHQFEVSDPETKPRIINPGEIYGGLTGNSTFVYYDTKSGAVTRVDV